MIRASQRIPVRAPTRGGTGCDHCGVAARRIAPRSYYRADASGAAAYADGAAAYGLAVDRGLTRFIDKGVQRVMPCAPENYAEGDAEGPWNTGAIWENVSDGSGGIGSREP